jgi:3-hydroxyacyl-[acyl-carrier-protein] dehydratase
MTDAAGETLESMEIVELMQLLPHRYPFLLVDRIVAIDEDNSAVGIKNVTVNEPHFQGHFPGHPVMPGVLIVEAMAQTAGAICIRHVALAEPPLVYFMTIDNAKFRKPVVPGDTLELHVTVARGRGKIWKFTGEARVGDALCAEAEFGAMILTPEEAAAKG